MDGQRIIIFGGGVRDVKTPLKPNDSLYVLDLINFEWHVPKVSGKIPSPRFWHKANIIGKYMVISFGMCNIYVFWAGAKILCNYYEE